MIRARGRIWSDVVVEDAKSRQTDCEARCLTPYALIMADGSQAEDLAVQAAEAVRNAVAAAEARAAEIIREAEAEAAGIRERAEADAREARERAEADARAQIEAARKALDELGGSLAAAVSAATPGAESTPSEPESEPEPEPELEPESPGAPEAPVTPPADATETAAGQDSQQAGDGDAAERLVAMKLAVEGKDPAAIEAELVERFGPGDRADLLHEVLSRIAR